MMNKLLFLSAIVIVSVSCSSNKQVSIIDPAEPEGVNRIDVRTSEELLEALENPEPGDYIFIHSGTYKINERIFINESGTPDKKITLIGDISGERPLLDYSAMEENSSNQGIVLKGNHWYIKGIQIYNAGDNGLHIRGNNNIVEFCSFFENSDSGLQMDDGASGNILLNCDSYFNADSKIENADGFAVKMDVGSGNTFIGCRAWNNLDDGWDGYLREADSIRTTYKNCWAFKNGFLKDGTEGNGDGNGFKTGGSDNKFRKHNVSYTRCLSVGNVNDGFDHNSNRGEVAIINCSVTGNGRNMGFSKKNPLYKLTVINTIVLGEIGSLNAEVEQISNNSWQNGLEATKEDFASLDVSQLSAPRKPDGSLPEVSFMHLTPKSDLRDAGMKIEISYRKKAPDLGAFEYHKVHE